MMTFYCNQKGLNYSLTVFTYLGIRLMPSSTPAALDFPARVIIDAYSQDAYKYIKEQETLERSRKLADMERQAAEAAAAAAFEQQQQSGGGGDGGEQHGDADVGDDTSDEYIFIKLRGKDTADEKIRVKKVGCPFLYIVSRKRSCINTKTTKELKAWANSFVRIVLGFLSLTIN